MPPSRRRCRCGGGLGCSRLRTCRVLSACGTLPGRSPRTHAPSLRQRLHTLTCSPSHPHPHMHRPQVHCEEGPGDILVFLTGQDEIESCERLISEAAAALPPDPDRPQLAVLPMYAALPPEAQLRVFQPAPPNTRKVGARWPWPAHAQSCAAAACAAAFPCLPLVRACCLLSEPAAFCPLPPCLEPPSHPLSPTFALPPLPPLCLPLPAHPLPTLVRSSCPPTSPRPPSPSQACATSSTPALSSRAATARAWEQTACR